MQRGSLVWRERRESKKKGWKMEGESVKRRQMRWGRRKCSSGTIFMMEEVARGIIPCQLFFIRRWME